MEKTLLLVGTDMAISQALGKVGDSFTARKASGLQVVSELGYGDIVSESRVEEILEIDSDIACVLTGMSSKPENSDAEITAWRMAREYDIPYGVYADTEGMVAGRPWFSKQLKENVSFVFVINEEEATLAKQHFPEAKIIISGDVRVDDWFFHEIPRDEVRGQLNIKPDEFAIMCPSNKILSVNVLFFLGVLRAMKLVIDNRRIDKPRIFFSIHPGDPKDHHPVYNFMAKDHKIRPEVITGEIMSGTEMVCGMDMIIQSMSTIGKQAACQRIPVIEFVTDLAMKHHEAVLRTKLVVK
ncbi:hypothetical protein CL630_03380 [bacterium]|jgi:hypothetical protein|nr:hypothetical protein [bacterium]|tara:strand:+ start:50514 stop:51404 length:891 start_codon:yes stop_codon:yes gene_type:complete